MKDLEVFENSANESDLQSVLTSDRFQQSLLVMERSLVANTFQPKLALYRQLPVLQGTSIKQRSYRNILAQELIIKQCKTVLY